MKDTDLAWLGGIWDGEGTIVFFSNVEKNGTKKLKPMVAVVNTDIGIINKTRKILEELGLSFVFTERKILKVHHLQSWVLSTANQKYIVILLEAILPYLFGIKKQKGEILLDYCKRRIEKTERLPSKGSTPYDEEDYRIFDEFQKVRSSTTTRETPTGEDIV